MSKRRIPIRLPGKRSKYRAVPTVVDGIRFSSKKEAKRYEVLRGLQKACKIFDLELQPRYPLVVNGVVIGEYRADFKYFTSITNAAMDMNPVIEDVKGMRTPVYRQKKKLMKAIYGIEVFET